MLRKIFFWAGVAVAALAVNAAVAKLRLFGLGGDAVGLALTALALFKGAEISK
jgi:hypothetical protein